ncbi:hypothetical protein D7V86_16570 [bacterium D16-51]|nr:hypothetical protein D7V96_18640 [bacterium D16-59]RKI57973.1 hypothetical protein D7V86_16570 [bacterium D16-51]
MIREGKKAEVIYAKHGEAVSPVRASVHTVQDATVTKVNIKKQAKANISKVLPQSVKNTEALRGKAVLCKGDSVPLETVTCKTVTEDITLQMLFSDKK